jgi:hypothetical protein
MIRCSCLPAGIQLALISECRIARESLAVGDSCRTQGSQCEPGKRIDDAGFESIHGGGVMLIRLRYRDQLLDRQ